MAKKIDTKRLAALRVVKAEDIVYQAVEDLAKAQAELSVISTGLNQQWSKLDDVRTRLKNIMYDLRRCRESGHCDLDETTANRLLEAKAGRSTLRRG